MPGWEGRKHCEDRGPLRDREDGPPRARGHTVHRAGLQPPGSRPLSDPWLVGPRASLTRKPDTASLPSQPPGASGSESSCVAVVRGSDRVIRSLFLF